MPEKLLVLSLTLILFCCGFRFSKVKENKPLDESNARRYAESWARKVGATINKLKQGQEGDFFGQLGSLGFDYDAKKSVLTVRAYIFPYSTTLNSRPDLLPWLNGIIEQEKAPAFDGVFEVCVPRWEPDKDPSLFLRIDLKDGNEKKSAVMSRLIKLRENSVLWRRAKFTDALDGLVKKHRQDKLLATPPPHKEEGK